MKVFVGAGLAVLALGLLAAGPVAFVLLVMIAPLLVVTWACGWGFTHHASRPH